jgi:type IV pilus assembly protein PilA
MRYAIRKMKAGFTLVELMIVVAIVGVLAVLAIYGVRKYISNAKTTEARNSLGQISKDAASALERESGASTPQQAGQSAGITRQLCGPSYFVPSTGTPPPAGKYQSQASDWASGDSSTGWKCLKFSLEQPEYFAYQYVATNMTAQTAAYTATANGDLNGDTITSAFTISGSLQGGSLTTSPTIGEVNPEE